VDEPVPPARRRIFWSCALLGWGVMAFGVAGLINESSRTRPDQWVRWFFGALLAHDAVAAPITFAVAAVIVARVPRSWRAAVQAWLFASAVIVLTTWPFLRGYGRSSINPSILPNNYARGLLLVLALLLGASAIAGWSASRRR
jgi:hypothetical protein